MAQSGEVNTTDPTPIAGHTGETSPVAASHSLPMDPEVQPPRVSQTDDADDDLQPFYVPKEALESALKSKEESSKHPAMIPGFRTTPFAFSGYPILLRLQLLVRFPPDEEAGQVFVHL